MSQWFDLLKQRFYGPISSISVISSCLPEEWVEENRPLSLLKMRQELSSQKPVMTGPTLRKFHPFKAIDIKVKVKYR